MTSPDIEPGGSGARPPARPWQARIKDGNGNTLGSGVLVSARHVITCAHVLNPDATAGTPPPPGPFSVDFPRSGSPLSLPAAVSPDGWFPELSSGQGDVAVLEFDHPLTDEVVPARLGKGQHSRGNPARVYGYPVSSPDGVWTDGTLADTAGPGGEWVQVSGNLATHSGRIEPGFSGGGVIDDTSDLVVGIIVTTTHLTTDRLAAFMIPTEVVARYWRRLDDLLGDSDDTEEPLGRTAAAEITAAFERLGGMLDDAARRRLVSRLPAIVRDQVGEPPTAHAIVHACRHPRHLRQLAHLARYYEGRERWPRRLDELLSRHGVPEFGDRAEDPLILSDGSRRDLHNALVAMPHFRDARSRHLFLDAFQLRVRTLHGVDLEPTKSIDATADAHALIDLCQSIPGLLRLIVETFPLGDQNRSDFGRLLLLVESLCTQPLLTDRERDDLVGLLADVAPGVLAEAHRYAEPPARATGPVPRGNAALVRQIETHMHRPDGLPRIFLFTEYVAGRVGDLGEQLRCWGDRTAARLGCHHADMERLRGQVATVRHQVADPILIIHVAPDAIRPRDRFLLSAWLQRDGRPGRAIDMSDEAESLDDIVTRVDRLLEEVYRRLEFETEALVIELVLPRSLITEPVDQWPITDLLSTPLGSRFRVVLRSYERLRQDRLRPRWRVKWRLAQQQRAASADAMHFVPHDADSTPQQIANMLVPDHKLALVLGGPPAAQPDLAPHDAYAAGLSAGVAYIAWIRDVGLTDQFRAAIVEALTDAPVRDLPRRITDWRSARQPDEDVTAALGQHVTLLVCDESRPVPFTNRDLRSPAKRG